MAERVTRRMRDILVRGLRAVRHLVGIGILMLLTSLFGCSDDNGDDKEGPPLYGPPPADAGLDGTLPADAGQDIAQPGLDSCAPVALYGPPPCSSDADCVEWMGDGWYCDLENTFDTGCQGETPWAICRQSAQDAGVAQDGCAPVALYGPPPCSNDADCQATHGDGWYCDLDNSFGNGCGEMVTWPTCREGETADAGVPDGCMPVALYGPPPCSSDADCAEWYGDDSWTCNEDNTFSNGCGETVTWPTCEKKS